MLVPFNSVRHTQYRPVNMAHTEVGRHSTVSGERSPHGLITVIIASESGPDQKFSLSVSATAQELTVTSSAPPASSVPP
jgi:hypothetical protein